MPDNLPVVWPADPHTFAKHAILERYLNAWFPILARRERRSGGPSQQVLFIDGFAGPGVYEHGQPGSPVIALRAAIEHKARFPVPIRFLFIEKDEDRLAVLKEQLRHYEGQALESKNLILDPPRHGECDSVLTEMLDKLERDHQRFGPALAFLDQFGYSAVSMDLIKRVLAYPRCEVFAYLDYKDMNRWIVDPNKSAGFTRTFGGEEWKRAISLPESERRACLLDEYKRALRGRGGARYVCSFSMFDSSNSPLYWLLFCTNHWRGLEEMKKAMWTVDKTGGFRFSDKDCPEQLPLLARTFDQDWLAEELKSRLAGKTVTVAQVREFVLTETPCYQFKRALQILETAKDPTIRAVGAPPGRRPGTFPDDDCERIRVKFGRGLF
jgi:three-Cys-motif partner protein